jgi:hypothetical protein
MTGLSAKTALLVQALKSLGEAHVDAGIIDHLRRKLSDAECALALSETRYVTSWVYEMIKKITANKEPRSAV